MIRKEEVFSLLQTGRSVLLDDHSLSTQFRSHLNSQTSRVFFTTHKDSLYLEDHFEKVLVEGWIDELIRYFIILKVRQKEDSSKLHYVPSYPLMEAWQILRKDHKALYAKLCAAFGDAKLRPSFNFYEGGEDRLRDAYSNAIKAYKDLFLLNPSQVFWLENFEENIYEPEAEEEDIIVQFFDYNFWINACQGVSCKSTYTSCTPVFGKQVVRSREVLI